MSDDEITSLSAGGLTPPARSEDHTPSPIAFPLEGKPGYYMIDGKEVSPGYVFSYAKRLKGRAYAEAKIYVMMESLRVRGAIVCEIGEHYLTEMTTEVHHRVAKNHHVAGTLGAACHAHNAQHGTPRASEIERESLKPAGIHPHSYDPTSGETASSWEMFPKTVEYLFHPINGKLARLGMEIEKDWTANNLPDILGIGRATTYGKYLHEFVKQGYLTEESKKGAIYLVRTGKKADALLKRELGIESQATPSEQSAKPEAKEAATA